MSLNNGQMLPARVRNMRQMKDVLNAEDVVLFEIERTVEKMYERESLLHEELINEKWLEEKLGNLTGGIAYVTKRKESLFIEIRLNTGKMTEKEEKEVVQFIEKWLPAHLAYGVIYEKMYEGVVFSGCAWQHDEIITLKEVIL